MGKLNLFLIFLIPIAFLFLTNSMFGLMSPTQIQKFGLILDLDSWTHESDSDS